MNSAKPRHNFWLSVVAIYSLYKFLSLARINEAGSVQVAWKQQHKRTLQVWIMFQVRFKCTWKSVLSCKQSTNQSKFITWLEQIWINSWNHWPGTCHVSQFSRLKQWLLMISRLNGLRLTKLTFHERLQIDS